jgi:hypothetical protein
LLFANRTPVQESIGLIRSLIALGATSRVDDAVEYLANADIDRSQSGATVLLLVVQQGTFDGYMANVDEAKELLRGYAQTQVAIAWEIAEAFGNHAAFTFEDVAHEIAELLDQ